MYIPVVPGQAGGGSFHSIKKHKPIRTRWPIEKKQSPDRIPSFSAAFASRLFFFGQAQQGHRHVLRHPDATKPMRSPQRRTHCRETAFFAVRMRHDGNTRPAAARKLQRDDILGHSDATKAMRSPQRHTHCGATTLLDPCLPVMVVSLYGLNWLSTLNVKG